MTMRSSRNTSLDPMTCSLHIAESFADSWNSIVAPWIERVAPLAWQSELPSLVIAPTRGHINAIKVKLTESGTSHLGLRFVTPPGLRSLLARDESASARAMTHLRLILAIAATEIT